MDFKYLLLNSIPQDRKLIEYGFLQNGNSFVLRKNIDEDFYADVFFSPDCFKVDVFETETDEKYVLIDVKSAKGAFVNGIRTKVNNLVNDIYEKCFDVTDVRAEYVQWLEEDLFVKGDFPWEDDNTSAVYRCSNSKWFALVMKIKFKNLGLESEEPVWVVNLKADADKIPQLVNNKSIFPAWHMNKKYWITVLLTGVTDFKCLQSLTLRSRELVEKK